MEIKALIFRTITWRTLSYISVLLLNIVIARVFKASLSGEINLIITGFSFLILLASLNLESSFTYFSLKKTIDLQVLNTIAVFWSCTFSLVFLAVTFFGKIEPFWKNDNLWLYSFLFVFGNLLTTYFSALFYGQQIFSMPNIITFGCNILITFFLILISRGLGNIQPTVPLFLKIYFVVTFVQGLFISFYFLHRNYVRLQLPKTAELKMIVNYIAFTFSTGVLLFLLHRLDYWLLLNLHHSANQMAEIGNYIQAAKLIFSFQIFSSMFGVAVFSSTASRNGDGKDHRLLALIIRAIFYFGIFFFLFILFFGRYLFTWLFGSSFHLIHHCFLLVLPGSIMLMTVSVTANYLAGLGRVRHNMWGVLLAIFVVTFLDTIFIPLYGIFAAAFVSGIGYFTYGVFMLFYFVKYSTGSWKEIFNFKYDFARLHSLLLKR